MLSLWSKAVVPFSSRFISTSTIHLAPKKAAKGKGGGGGGSTPTANKESDEIYNIFVGLPDATLYPDEFYPKWMWDLLKPKETYGELSLMFVHGKNIENATLRQYRRFHRLHRKYMIKLNNVKLQKKRGALASEMWDF